MIEQQIFLGGQVSHKYKEFQAIAKMSPDYADLYFFIERMIKFDKENETDEDKILLELLMLFGEIDFIRTSATELTRLSMILGDTRGRSQVKGVIDELRKTRQNTE